MGWDQNGNICVKTYDDVCEAAQELLDFLVCPDDVPYRDEDR